MKKLDEKINAEWIELSPEWKYEEEKYELYRKRFYKIFDPCKKESGKN